MMAGETQGPENSPERLAELYRSGLSMAQIAAATGMTGSRIYKTLLRLGVKMRGRNEKRPSVLRSMRITPEEMAALYESGASIETVAMKAGVRSSYAARLLRNLGVAIRPRPQLRKSLLSMEEIALRYRSGESGTDLAKEAGINMEQVREILVVMGEPLRAPFGDTYSSLDDVRFSPDEIVELYEEGETVQWLAKALGVSREIIRTLLLKRGIKLRGRGGAESSRPHEIIPQAHGVARRYGEGESMVEIATALEVTEWQVRTVLLKLGVKLRSSAGMRGDDVVPPPITAEQAASLYRKGRSVEGIMVEVGLSRQKVMRMLREQKTKMRGTGEALRESPEKRKIPDAEVARRYEKGESLQSVAAAAGTTAAVVRRILAEHGVRLRPKEAQLGLSETEILALYQAGKGVEAIATKAGCSSRDPILRILKRHRVKIRGHLEGIAERAAKPRITAKEMAARYREGASLSQIAEAAEIVFQRVAVILRREGVALRGRGAVKKEDGEGLRIAPEKMVELYNTGSTLVQIAEIAGSNRKRVGDILKRHGVKLRTRQDYGTDWTAVAKR